MRKRKLFIGRRIREIRLRHQLTQPDFADRLGLSKSYLNQIENDHRPATVPVLIALSETFGVDIASLSDAESDRLLADLTEALADPLFAAHGSHPKELESIAQGSPSFARAFLLAHQTLRRVTDQLVELDLTLERHGGELEPSPYDEVRDYFHYIDNYVHDLDLAGEALATALATENRSRGAALCERLESKHAVRVRIAAPESSEGGLAGAPLRRFDPVSRELVIDGASSAATRDFQLAFQIALLEHGVMLERIVGEAGFRTEEAGAICRIGLANFFAGAVLLPYERFLETAASARHDLEHLAVAFEVSVEQVAHRLSTLQRPGHKGVPFFFARVDAAGNITKRHSATRLRFARFGSACPLWNVHRAFETPDRILRQLASTPDGVRYLCLATTVTKQRYGFGRPTQRYALALGCEISHASNLVYADGLDTGCAQAFEPIGVSCRICERTSCHQRAIPPLKRDLLVNENARGTLPYRLL